MGFVLLKLPPVGSTAALRGFRAQTPKPSTASAALAHPRHFLLGFAISVLSPGHCANFLEAQTQTFDFWSILHETAEAQHSIHIYIYALDWASQFWCYLQEFAPSLSKPNPKMCSRPKMCSAIISGSYIRLQQSTPEGGVPFGAQKKATDRFRIDGFPF